MMGVELLLCDSARLCFRAFHTIAERRRLSLEGHVTFAHGSTGSHMGLCLQSLLGGGGRALRRVLAAAWRRIIGGRYGGNSGAADARRGACQSG